MVYTACIVLIDYDRYIQFYVEWLVNQENISLIYHLALKVKTVRDPDGDDASEVKTR
jgi:sister-chromatid-cohesion protein PDS5